jgi:chemotaxis protein methyltransferase CheR
VNGSAISSAHLEELAGILRLPLQAYPSAQLGRRLTVFCRTRGWSTVDDLLIRLRRDPALVETLRHHLTIHVTTFMRDLEYWERLREVLRQRPAPAWAKAWSTATSTGAEAVSVAGLLTAEGWRASILATDVDASVLATARAGWYSRDAVGTLPEAWRERLLKPAEADGFRVRPDLARLITYRRLDLLTDPYPTGPFDLIVCRNVLIYFRGEQRRQVVRALSERLAPAGILFLGSTEVLIGPEQYGLRPIAPTLYGRL